MILSSDVKFPMKILLFFECLTCRKTVDKWEIFLRLLISAKQKKIDFFQLEISDNNMRKCQFLYYQNQNYQQKKNFFCDDKTKRRRQNFTKKIKSNHEMDFHSGNWLLVDKIKQAEKKISGKTTNNWSNWFDMQWNWFAFISSSFQFLS